MSVSRSRSWLAAVAVLMTGCSPGPESFLDDFSRSVSDRSRLALEGVVELDVLASQISDARTRELGSVLLLSFEQLAASLDEDRMVTALLNGLEAGALADTLFSAVLLDTDPLEEPPNVVAAAITDELDDRAVLEVELESRELGAFAARGILTRTSEGIWVLSEVANAEALFQWLAAPRRDRMEMLEAVREQTRELGIAQELYFADRHWEYSSDLAALLAQSTTLEPGPVILQITSASALGWGGVGIHPDLGSDVGCAVTAGRLQDIPRTYTPGGRLVREPYEPVCDDEGVVFRRDGGRGA